MEEEINEPLPNSISSSKYKIKELSSLYHKKYINQFEFKENDYKKELKAAHLENTVTPAKFWKYFFESNFDLNSMEVIARGNFGEVKKGRFIKEESVYSNEVVALKYPLGENHDYMKEFFSLCHEVSCTLILHPNIVNYIGGLRLYKPDRIGVIMEFISNNLRNSIEKDNRLRELENQIKVAKQISSGMNFLHSLNPYILHKDLRSPNILINDDLDCKIADFGISTNLVYKGIESKNIYTSLIPPECKNKSVTFNSTLFSKKGDVYFFGWILFELFTGKKYEENFESEFGYLQILQEFENKVINQRHKDFKSLIIKSLRNDPSSRPSFFELLISFNNLLENSIDYSIISQTKEENLTLIMENYKLKQFDLIEYSNSLGRKLVHEYCIYNNLEGLKELISIIGKEYLNLVDKYNCTCAHFASRNGNIKILKFLSENGFNKWNEREKRFNLFPLSIAIAMKHDKCVKFLSCYSNNTALNESLISSSQEGNLDYCNLFLEKGANVSFVDDEYTATSLYWACRNGHLEIVKELIHNGANLNQSTSELGCTALYIACKKGHLEIAKELVQNGADINLGRVRSGTSPLFIASQNGNLDVVKELLAKGANVNQAATNNGCTPLYIASEQGHSKVASELIKHGANVNMIYFEDYDSLIPGSEKDFVVKDFKYSFTPIYVAWWDGKTEVISILKDKSDIKLNIQLAKQNNHPNALKFFESLLQ